MNCGRLLPIAHQDFVYYRQHGDIGVPSTRLTLVARFSQMFLMIVVADNYFGQVAVEDHRPYPPPVDCVLTRYPGIAAGLQVVINGR